LHGFRAIVFDGTDTAYRALRTLKDADSAHSWREDVAVVSRNRDGTIHAHSRAPQDDGMAPPRAGLRQAAGGMLSLVYGMSALMGASAILAFEDSAIADFADALTDDSSALLLFADAAALSDFATAMAPFGGKVIHADVREGDLSALTRA
jgi:uncharacterized membrane protein